MKEEYTQHHYVPQWYQKKFMLPGQSEYFYLDLYPKEFADKNGNIHQANAIRKQGTKKCFVENDLYTRLIGTFSSKDIEKFFFGEIDRKGKDAVEYFENFGYPLQDYKNYVAEILTYMSAQKLRTPKGLELLKKGSGSGGKNEVLSKMMHQTDVYNAIWAEAIWQIADASTSETKFIVSDHPVTVYNKKCGLKSNFCRGVEDPEVWWQGTHTIFPLSLNKVLIMTNLSWVRNPYASPIKSRPNPREFGSYIFKFLDVQTARYLSEEEVRQINFVIKSRAYGTIAAAKKEWLFPENFVSAKQWHNLGEGYLFMPDPRSIHIGGEMVLGFSSGMTIKSDEYGRSPWNPNYSKESTKGDEFETLYRFKGDFAYHFGPNRRGRIMKHNGLEPETDSEDFHAHMLSYRRTKYKERNGTS